MPNDLLNYHVAEVLNPLPAGVYTVDATGLIRFYNRHAAELWGHAPTLADPAHRYCGAFRLLTPDGTLIPHDQCPVVDVLRDGQTRWITHALVERPDGSRVHVQASISALRDPAGNILGAINCFQSIDDRVAAEQELRRQLDVTRAITDHAADSLFLCDARGVVTFANPAALRTFGFSLAELQSRPLHDLIHHSHPDGRNYPMPACPLGRVFSRGETVHDHEDTFFHKSGAPVPVLCSNAPILHNGRVVAAALVVHDVSERRRAEQDIRHRAESLKLLADTATRLLMADRPEDLLPSILDSICRHLHCSHYFNYLVVDEPAPGLRLNAYSGIPDATARAIAHLDFGQALCGTAADLATRIVSIDVQHNDDPRASLVRSFGATAYCCHPLIANGRVVGTLSYAATDRDAFSPEDLDLLRSASDQIAMALHRSRLGAELQRRNAELTQANAAKDQFLAALSHELRTPLTPVLFATSALESNPALPSDVRGDLSMIRHNVELEARLIDDLLDLTKITRGKLDLLPTPTDAHDLIRQTLATCCGPDLRTKNLSLTLDLDAPHPTVSADPARLQQILWNLLKNATKFTPDHGTITIRTRNEGRVTRGKGQAKGASPSPSSLATCPSPLAPSLVIEITDTGIGIPPETLPRVFDAFNQGDPAVTRRFGGLGLGLAITKALVDLHNGSIRAHSDGAGKGATFTLTLPTTSPAPHAGAERSAAPDSPSSLATGNSQLATSPLNILILEDHESTASLLTRILRRAHHTVTTAATISDARALLGAGHYDLLISDLGLPDGSALDLLPSLDGHRPRRSIALSGYGMDHDRAASRAAGFHAHLTKPIDLAQLEQTISAVMAGEPLPR